MIDPKERIVFLDNTVRSAFDSCRYKTYLNHFHKGRGVAPRTTAPPLRFGSAIHRALEQFHSGADLDMATGAGLRAYQELEENPNVVITETDAMNINKECAMLEGIMEAYAEQYSDDGEKFEALSTELIVEATAGEVTVDNETWLIKYFGKIDVVGRNYDGTELFIMDHKTVSDFREAYYDSLHYDFQTTGYCILGSQYFKDPVRNVTYNIIRKSRLRLKKGESHTQYTERIRNDYAERPEDYFKRVDAVRTQQQLQECYAALLEVGRDIVQCHKTQHWRKNMASCSIYSGCAFRNICVSGVVDSSVNFYLRGERKDGYD